MTPNLSSRNKKGKQTRDICLDNVDTNLYTTNAIFHFLSLDGSFHERRLGVFCEKGTRDAVYFRSCKLKWFRMHNL